MKMAPISAPVSTVASTSSDLGWISIRIAQPELSMRRRLAVLALAFVIHFITAARPIYGALNDFALSSAGATVISNGSHADRLINGITREDSGIYPTWEHIAEPFFRVELPSLAAGLPFHGATLRRASASAATLHPFRLDIFDVSNNLLTAFTSSENDSPYNFSLPQPILGVASVEFRYLGPTVPLISVSEINAWFESGFRVGGSGIGTTALQDVQLEGGVPGVFKDVVVSVHQLAESGLALTEVEVLNADENVVPVTGWETAGVEGSVRQLSDGIVASNNGAVVFGRAGFSVTGSTRVSGIRLYSDLDSQTNDLSNMAIGVRDAFFSPLIYYYEPVAASSNGAGHIEEFHFTLGRTATAYLDSNETYEFELDAAKGLSDVLTVRKLDPQVAVTKLDLNDSSLELLIREGEPQLGDEYRLLNVDFITGSFRELSAAPLRNGLRWDFSRLYQDGIVRIVPEPTPNFACLFALLCFREIFRGRVPKTGATLCNN
jgi:hypothetical protein